MQQLLLYLGLIGFEPDDESRVRSWLATHAQRAQHIGDSANGAHPAWQVVDFQEADALLICGSGVLQGQHSSVQFKPSVRKHGTPLGLQLDDIKLPYALSHTTSMKALGIDTEPAIEFDPRQSGSLLKAIQHFETVLQPLRSLYALALEMTTRQAEIDRTHTYHLERNGALDAIVDAPAQRMLLRPGVRPDDIHAAAWLRRPRSANFAPAHFMECSSEEISWLFGLHCSQPDLPARYAQKTIYLRRNPRVRNSLLYPRHAALLDRLSLGTANLPQLQLDLPATAQWLERDLFALYLTRAISTAPATADGRPNSSWHKNAGLDTTGSWMLDRLSRRASTVTDDLKPLF